ncbi:MAG: DUF2391 family protein [Nanoarchaeota archaeon]
MDEEIIYKIERELDEEKKELCVLEKNIDYLKKTLVFKTPSKFSIKDVVNSFFGSLLIGLTFVFKGGLIELAINLTYTHLVLIVFVTLLILVFQILFISYLRVPNKKERKVVSFVIKRLIVLYSVSLFVTLILIFLLNVNNNPLIANNFEIIRNLIILVSFPCTIGAAIPGLLKKY